MVVDTHAFIWYCLGDSRLPSEVRAQIESAPDRVWVPTVCLWEAEMLVAKGRVELTHMDPGRYLLRVLRSAGFLEAPLTSEIAILSRQLPFRHEDPADRFIGATAVALAEPLATSDKDLRGLDFLTYAY